jgi:hypothetical protein
VVRGIVRALVLLEYWESNLFKTAYQLLKIKKTGPFLKEPAFII